MPYIIPSLFVLFWYMPVVGENGKKILVKILIYPKDKFGNN